MIDTISRHVAIDAINHICPVDTEYDCTLLDRVDVRCVLSGLPSAQPEQRWITCSERLPEEDGQYLITVKYKHVNDSYEDVYAEHGEWYDGRWDMFCFGHCGEVEDIIAWMPLPEPYKGEEYE